MKKFFEKVSKWFQRQWYKLMAFFVFKLRNPVRWKGEKGAFKVVIREYDMEIRSLSGNFRLYRTADEHPYGYLAASAVQGKEENIFGYAKCVYEVSCLLTTDQKFVDDITKAVISYESRLLKTKATKDDAEEEKIALEEVRQVQEVIDMPKKQRRQYERDVNGRFKKAVKKAKSE